MMAASVTHCEGYFSAPNYAIEDISNQLEAKYRSVNYGLANGLSEIRDSHGILQQLTYCCTYGSSWGFAVSLL
jgi:hypothetical protein